MVSIRFGLGTEINHQVSDDRVIIERLKNHSVSHPGGAGSTGPTIDGHNAAGALTPVAPESPESGRIFPVGAQVEERFEDRQGFS
jgi:hypothetical protein